MPRRSIIAAAVIGAVLGALAHAAASAAVRPAFVLVAGRTIDAQGLEPYRQAAGPGALAAGMQMLARADASRVRVLEGSWPQAADSPGAFVAVERYRSMEELLEFWYSDAYQQAMPLRAGKIELDYVIAFEPE